MAFLRKITVICYVDPNGKRVNKGTPGAVKKKIESKKWYVCFRVKGKIKQVPAFRDRQSSEAKKRKIELNLERGEAGLTDPFEEHLDRAVFEHLEEYLPVLRKRNSNQKYCSETERILRNMLTACKVITLRDLNGDAVEKYLTEMEGAPNTRKKHHSAMSGFVKWLFKRKRIERNFLLTVDVPTGGVRTPIRSLDADELQRILNTTRERPLRDALMIRRGERKGQLLARVRPEKRAAFERQGRERGLLYKTSILTGLRKEELEKLQVWFINFDHKPYPILDLPARATKNKQEARLLLLPELAEELRQWVHDTGKGEKDLLFNVPDKLNLIFQRDREAAGVSYQDGKGAVAKFRSLRKSGNVLLSRAKVPLKIRQLFMRHEDIRLTAHTYDDLTLEEMASEIVPVLQNVNLR